VILPLEGANMDTFDPVLFSEAENQFLLENVGTSPAVALNQGVPPSVNPRAVRPVLQEIADRMAIEETQQVPWVGVEAIKAAIAVYIRQDAEWAQAHERSNGRVPRLPSMYVKDQKGRYHRAGPGSDSDRARTWLDKEGERHRFAVDFDGFMDVFEEDLEAIVEAPKALIHNERKYRWECPIKGCHHTESYKATSRSSQNAAKARMARHLKKPGSEIDIHRELYTLEFGN